MQARDTTVEESTDGEQVDLEELITTPLDIFLSDVSPEPEIRQSATEPPAAPVSPAEHPLLTLAQQLRAASHSGSTTRSLYFEDVNRPCP